MSFAVFNKSIRFRLALWIAFLLVCILAGFGVTAFQLQRVSRFDQLDEELKRRVGVLSSTLRAPPMMGNNGFGPHGPAGDFDGLPKHDDDEGPHGPHGPPPDESHGPDGRFTEFHPSAEVNALFGTVMTNGFYYVLWSRTDAGEMARSTNAPAAVPQPDRPGKDTSIFTRTRGGVREAYHYTERGHCVLVGCSIDSLRAASERFAAWLTLAGFAVLALSVGVSWLLVGRALRPVGEISDAARRISAGNLSERIDVTDTDNELGQLARTLNSTFMRLAASFDQQKQFTTDAAHELRTPLAVLISEAQTVLARERTAAEYQESIAASLDTAQRMRRLAETLLELARLDAGQAGLHRERLDLAAATRECVELVRPLAAERRVTIRTDLANAPCPGDPVRLGQVITNLLTNAIKYNQDGGEVRVTTRLEDDVAVLTVADTGPGIPAAELPRVFERFYRADKARSRSEGNAGLGLAICKAIVEAHGGTVVVVSEPDKGATFTVRLPATV